ncbi:biotin--[acetyl-CoA-carboxylase] ligase [Gracilimonas sp.]|uniref:biotin--[acetyl-CoA-carboxylase] ligase n=1 Tax=Gracilimonas sp. TaxID=1974203 RepID=UPI0028727CEC|nr:biotin--[acetyl-CoA-carboxylase] ligase [Gracilimonas sp.]
MFSTSLFEKHLATSWLGRSFYFFEELPSTNSHAKKMERKSSLHGVLVLTDFQSGGRGQHNRKWVVEPEQNLTFSLVFEPAKANRLNLLTLTCALAIKEVLENEAGINGILKWPNDVLVKEKKICGILTETVFIGNQLDRIVAGIGLNINQLRFSDEIKHNATSVSIESGEETEREELLAKLLQRIEFRYRQWVQQNQELVREINQSIRGVGKWCSLQVNDEVLKEKYKFLGVNESGELLAMDENLDVRKYSYEQVRVIEHL